MAEKPRFYDVTLTKIVDLTDSVRHFVIEYDKAADSRFLAGQFLMVHIDREGKPHKKAYSIASSPSILPRVELCIKLVEGGFTTNWFWGLKTGDRFQTSIPYGVFTIKEPWQEELVFVGTGTGVAPLRGMIQNLYEKGCQKRITLIFGNRYENEILYESEWREMEKKHPNFRFIPTISRGKSWKGETAYVQDIVKREFEGKIQGKDFYGCGLAPMCRSLRETLLAMGVERQFIHFEQFT